MEVEESGLISRRSGARGWSRSRIIAIAVAAVVVVALVIVVPVVLITTRKDQPTRRPNVIFMIGDGFGPASLTFARTMSGKALNLDGILVGTVRTYAAENLITDSAAGATAYSCGKKTYNEAIAVDANRVPCGTLMEAAKAKGMKTGLVATSRITHATPAAFSAHVIERDMEQLIAKQQIDNGIDLMFGGGAMFYTNRGDGLNLFSYAQGKDYQVLRTPTDLAGGIELPAVGLFASSHMTWEIDRNATLQPSLFDMATKALDVLSAAAGSDGFFLLVEGSRIDMAAHENDPAAHNAEILMYDRTVGAMVEWAKKDGNTIVVSTADHETGGLTLGRNFQNLIYPVYQWYPDVVRGVTASCEFMATQILQGADIRTVFATYAGISDLSDQELSSIQLGNGTANFLRVIGNVISYRAKIGWTTFGHSAVDVNLYSAGLYSDELRGNYNNIDVGNFVASKFGLNIEAITEEIKFMNTNDTYYPYKKFAAPSEDGAGSFRLFHDR